MSARLFPACVALVALVLALPATALEQCVDDGTTLACVVVDAAGGEQGVFLFDEKTRTTGHAVVRETTAADGRTTSANVSMRAVGGAQTVVLTLALTDAAQDGQPESGRLALATWSAGGVPLLAVELHVADTDGDGRPDADGLSWHVAYGLP